MADYTLKDKSAIVGIGQTEFAKNIGRSEVRAGLEAILKAVDDAGLKPQDVDGITLCDMQYQEQFIWAQNLGCGLTFWSQMGAGGGACASLVGHAAMAIATGQASVVVALRARNRGSGGRPWASGYGRIVERWGYEAPYGLMRPVDQTAILARRHMHLYGTTSRQFGAVAVTQRQHATLNPNALMRTPITIEDHQNSRMISDPLRLLDNCLESDGACAVVLVSADRANDLKQQPVYVMSAVQMAGPQPQVMDWWYKPGELEAHTRYGAKRLFDMAGIRPKDVDIAILYDAFSPLVIMQLEDYGFCKPGEGGPFVEEGRIQGPDGELPVNTHGGSLSEAYIHGMNGVLEAVRQLRGQSTCQVPNAEIAIATGGPPVPTGSIILRR